MRSVLLLSSVFRFVSVTLTLACLAGACSAKPDTALCGRYYRQILHLQQEGLSGVLAGLKTSQGKSAVIDHCMQMERADVECVLQAGSLSAAESCEYGAAAEPVDTSPMSGDLDLPSPPVDLPDEP